MYIESSQLDLREWCSTFVGAFHSISALLTLFTIGGWSDIGCFRHSFCSRSYDGEIFIEQNMSTTECTGRLRNNNDSVQVYISISLLLAVLAASQILWEMQQHPLPFFINQQYRGSVRLLGFPTSPSFINYHRVAFPWALRLHFSARGLMLRNFGSSKKDCCAVIVWVLVARCCLVQMFELFWALGTWYVSSSLHFGRILANHFTTSSVQASL